MLKLGLFYFNKPSKLQNCMFEIAMAQYTDFFINLIDTQMTNITLTVKQDFIGILVILSNLKFL